MSAETAGQALQNGWANVPAVSNGIPWMRNLVLGTPKAKQAYTPKTGTAVPVHMVEERW